MSSIIRQSLYILIALNNELGRLSKKLHISLSKNINNSSIDKFHIFGRFVKETFKKVKNVKKKVEIFIWEI